MLTKERWKLPAPPEEGEDWLPVVRLGSSVPWGYEQDPNDPDILWPNKKALDLLEEAKKLLKRYPSREVAAWLTRESGIPISYNGLLGRIRMEQKKRTQIANLRLYAERAKAASEKAERLAKSVGGDYAKRSS